MTEHKIPPDTPTWMLSDQLARRMLKQGKTIDEACVAIERRAIVENS